MDGAQVHSVRLGKKSVEDDSLKRGHGLKIGMKEARLSHALHRESTRKRQKRTKK
jgi:hypothetical protein